MFSITWKAPNQDVTLRLFRSTPTSSAFYTPKMPQASANAQRSVALPYNCRAITVQNRYRPRAIRYLNTKDAVIRILQRDLGVRDGVTGRIHHGTRKGSGLEALSGSKRTH